MLYNIYGDQVDTRHNTRAVHRNLKFCQVFASSLPLFPSCQDVGLIQPLPPPPLTHAN